VNATIVNDTSVCIGDRAILIASGGVSYSWYSSENMPILTESKVSVVIYVPTTFYVDITDAYGCTITLSVFVDTLANPKLSISDIIKNFAHIEERKEVENLLDF